PGDLADVRHDGKLVGRNEEQEQRAEQREVLASRRSADALDEVRKALHEQLDEVLEAARLFAQGACRDQRYRGEERDDEKHREVRAGVREVEPHRDAEHVELRTNLTERDKRLTGQVEERRYVGIARWHALFVLPCVAASFAL